MRGYPTHERCKVPRNHRSMEDGETPPSTDTGPGHERSGIDTPNPAGASTTPAGQAPTYGGPEGVGSPSYHGHPFVSAPLASPAERPSRSAVKVTAAIVALVALFGVAAAGTAAVTLAIRGELSLPWPSKRQPRGEATEPAPTRGHVPPTGSIGQAPGEPEPRTPNPTPDHAGQFESALGYRAQLPPGWRVEAEASKAPDPTSAHDAFSNGSSGEQFAYLQIAAIGTPGIEPLAAARIVADNAASRQGYAIMVPPSNDEFGAYRAAKFRAYAVQSGFPLVVEVYVVASPSGDLIQVQFSSGLESFASNAQALAQFQQSFRFVES